MYSNPELGMYFTGCRVPCGPFPLFAFHVSFGSRLGKNKNIHTTWKVAHYSHAGTTKHVQRHIMCSSCTGQIMLQSIYFVLWMLPVLPEIDYSLSENDFVGFIFCLFACLYVLVNFVMNCFIVHFLSFNYERTVIVDSTYFVFYVET